MKKKLSTLLLSLAMSVSLVIPASAAPYNPQLPSPDVEPINNFWNTAPYITNNVNGSSITQQGWMDNSSDIDNYAIYSNGTRKQLLFFWPPDNQKYTVSIFEKSDFNDGYATAIISRDFINGNAEYLEFIPKPNTHYIIQVWGGNLSPVPSDPYWLISSYQ
ncbi:hypothetical protein [Paenibacillus assamensis]|uniref:hypothetical protein n=1 Tax=Paenibacillus assamensis TaxID=311244 RepID=UPI00048DB01B|nr:hypothetical protein [Paenibacillus assamensis]